mgnify:CR=1 FL=1
MNLVHLKYAVEVAETGSINKASEKLYVSQPNLSRAIKELEASLGVTIFDRSAKGMVLTPDGEVFVRYARSILRQVDAIEEVFSKGTTEKKKFSISVPRASYVTDAFAEFSKLLDKDTPVEIFYKETNSMRSMKNILQDEYKLCIIRYAEGYDKYYKSTFDEKGLTYELITEFQYVLLMSKNSTLAEKEDITFDDLRDRIEIAHADPYVPSLPLSEVKKEELPEYFSGKIKDISDEKFRILYGREIPDGSWSGEMQPRYFHVGLPHSAGAARQIRAYPARLPGEHTQI